MPNSLLFPHHPPGLLTISSHSHRGIGVFLFINDPTLSRLQVLRQRGLGLLLTTSSSTTTTTRALRGRGRREWNEYDEAVKDKDLARALRFLKQDIPDPGPQDNLKSSSPSPLEDDDDDDDDSSILPSLKGVGGGTGRGLSSGGGWVVGSWENRDLEVLDACLNADDMTLVGATYSFLKDRGFLPNFAKCRNIGTSLTLTPPSYTPHDCSRENIALFILFLFNVRLAACLSCSIT